MKLLARENIALSGKAMVPDDPSQGFGLPISITLSGGSLMEYIQQYLQEAVTITQTLSQAAVEKMVETLIDVRAREGRLFFVGVGGGAGNATHAVNDARKIANIESYSVTDNVPELTARINDEGWETCYTEWLKASRLNSDDAVFVFSVGGGSKSANISMNLVHALQFAKGVGSTIVGIVGRDGGFTAETADACIVVPTVNPHTVTPHTESFQLLLWHLIASHPKIMRASMKWESIR